MNLDIQSHQNLAILTVQQSRMDATDASVFRTRFKQLLDNGMRDFLIDLTSVGFMDSSALGALVSAYKLSHVNAGSVALCGVNGAVEELMTLTQLNCVFACYSSVDQALSFPNAA
ncbi:hypothetical protein AB833_00415 [Chromatiales bacterium (ex Bugula neritina AB1)]|nr:hypothetical protein AB833_00415 [Chromatiales bacterium (ex Bugula neritina AB1)]